MNLLKTYFRTLFFLAGSCFLLDSTVAQTTKKPYCLSYNNSNLYLEKVELTEHATTLHLIYNNLEKSPVDISIAPYVQIKEKQSGLFYSMTRALGIEIEPGTTQVERKTGHRFTLVFPPVQGGCYEFDLFECPEADCFNIEGIKIENSLPIQYSRKNGNKFQRAYDFMAYYNGKAWGDWQKNDYRFFFNINDNNDFRLYKSSSETLLYRTITPAKRVPATKASAGYQQSTVREAKSGNLIDFKFFDNGDVMMTYPNGTAYQFSN